jgi:hypothetical protein
VLRSCAHRSQPKKLATFSSWVSFFGRFATRTLIPWSFSSLPNGRELAFRYLFMFCFLAAGIDGTSGKTIIMLSDSCMGYEKHYGDVHDLWMASMHHPLDLPTASILVLFDLSFP